MVSTKHAFWQALIFTIIIFWIGLLMGFFLENSRSDKVESNLLNSEINLLDQQIRDQGINQFNISCGDTKKSTFLFADKIYNEAVLLEEYDSKSKFSSTLKILHKRYDLLRMILWMESIQMKEKCNEDYHTIVYLFNYADDDINIKAEQASISKLLLDIKNKYGNRVLLIPIAANLDLESVNLIKEKYNISKAPAIIIDEKTVIIELPTFDKLEKTIFESK